MVIVKANTSGPVAENTVPALIEGNVAKSTVINPFAFALWLASILSKVNSKVIGDAIDDLSSGGVETNKKNNAIKNKLNLKYFIVCPPKSFNDYHGNLQCACHMIGTRRPPVHLVSGMNALQLLYIP
jgi:hypothetical protein